MANLKQIEDIV